MSCLIKNLYEDNRNVVEEEGAEREDNALCEEFYEGVDGDERVHKY